MARQLFEYYGPDNANIIVESSNDGKDLCMSGLFIQGEVKNQNGRVYPKDEIVTAVESIGKRLHGGETVLGELDHPTELQINLDRVSHMISEMRVEGSNGYGKLKLLDEMEPFMGGGEMIDKVTMTSATWNEVPYKFEAGTPNFVQAIVLGAAIDYLESIGMNNITYNEEQLTSYALDKLKKFIK